jgi:hypothetical protein
MLGALASLLLLLLLLLLLFVFSVFQTCQLLHNKSREAAFASVLTKRKVHDEREEGGATVTNSDTVSDTPSDTHPLANELPTHTHVPPYADMRNAIKLSVLDHFSENLRELIVQSLASKMWIPENNCATTTNSVSAMGTTAHRIDQSNLSAITTIKEEFNGIKEEDGS